MAHDSIRGMQEREVAYSPKDFASSENFVHKVQRRHSYLDDDHS